jgi:ABC-2 type transport system ATP-binding protein
VGRVPIRDASHDLARAARELEAAGGVPVDLGLRRPTLDDVFLHLTGQPA